MKLLLLSDANSVHTFKWVNSLSRCDIQILLFSFFKPNVDMVKKYQRINVGVISPDINLKTKNFRQPSFHKLRYLKSLKLLKRTIKTFLPDIVHAHYISSYGFLGYLSGFKPLILSAWGSDIFLFPTKSYLHKKLLRYIIKKSDAVCSSSKVMSDQMKKIFNREKIFVIPFGIDIKVFKPTKKDPNIFTVGTIKSIEDHNGIDCLIDAAKIIIEDFKKDIHFEITGDGTLSDKMKKKIIDYNLQNRIKLSGFVDHDKIISKYNRLSIFVAVSLRESFGVSILEAAACSVPSITSNIGGLVEVNLDNKTGLVINPNDPHELANSIIYLFENEKIRKDMGKFGRERVISDFNWDDNVSQMINLYKNFIK